MGGQGQEHVLLLLRQGIHLIRIEPKGRRPRPNQVYPLTEKEKHVLLPLAANSKMRLGIRYESGPGLVNTASRFRVMSMEGASVRGGSTFLMRH